MYIMGTDIQFTSRTNLINLGVMKIINKLNSFPIL